MYRYTPIYIYIYYTPIYVTVLYDTREAPLLHPEGLHQRSSPGGADHVDPRREAARLAPACINVCIYSYTLFIFIYIYIYI